jgi:hypothetical protein
MHEAAAGDPALEAMAGGAGSSIGKGGMITKILAAKRAAGSGASTVIAWGREPMPAAPGARRGHRHAAGGADAEAPGAQALDGRPPATARRGDGGRGRRRQGARRGQEPAAHRHDRVSRASSRAAT